MRNIKLDFLPFTVTDCYKTNLKEIANNSKIQLFESFNTKIKLVKQCINKCYLEFQIASSECGNINKILLKKYNEPKYVLNDYTNVWEVNGVYIIHFFKKIDDENYDHKLIVTFTKPKNIIEYNFYNKVKDLFLKISQDWDIISDDFSYDEKSKQFKNYFYTKQYVYHIKLFKKTLQIITLKINEEGEVIEDWIQKIRYKDIDQIDEIISSYFEEVMTNDECLNHKFILKVKLKYYNDKNKYIKMKNKYQLSDDQKIGFIKETKQTNDEYLDGIAELIYPAKGFEEKRINKNFNICFKNKIVGEGYITEVVDNKEESNEEI